MLESGPNSPSSQNPGKLSIDSSSRLIMAQPARCPICNEPLASSSQQLRSDDEPTVLVTSCSKHGQVGSMEVESTRPVFVITNASLIKMR